MIRLLCNIFFSILVFAAIANDSELFDRDKFKVDSVYVDCEDSSYCIRFKEKATEHIANKEYRFSELKNELRSLLYDFTIIKFKYSLYEEGGKIKLDLSLEFRPVIGRVDIKTPVVVDVKQLTPILNIKSGMLYDQEDVSKGVLAIKQWYLDQGYINVVVESKVDIENGMVNILYTVQHSGAVKISGVSIITDNESMRKRLDRVFFDYAGKNWKKLDVKLAVDKTVEMLMADGYLLASVENLPGLLTVEDDAKVVKLRVKVIPGPRIALSFFGNVLVDDEKLKVVIKKTLRDRGVKTSDEDVVRAIVDEYKDSGIYNTVPTFRVLEGVDSDGLKFKNYMFNIVEGSFVKVSEIKFTGVSSEEQEMFTDYYYEKGSDLAIVNRLDEKYLERFTKQLEQKMFETGFVRALVSQPRVVWSENGVVVEYEVDKGRKCYIDGIDTGRSAPKDLVKKILSKLSNKIGGELNLVLLQTDLDLALEIAKNDGYLLAEMLNGETGEVVEYNYNFSKAKLHFSLKLGPKVKLRTVIVSGNVETKSEVITRSTNLNFGDVISQEEIEKIKRRLVSLGIFSIVEISPVVVNKDNSKNEAEAEANLVIYVKEKNFGAVEIAPGYRTDIGVKLSSLVTYSNVGGMNRVLSLKGMLNDRLDFDSFDQRRQIEQVRRLEYMFNVGYVEPYLFGYELVGELSASGDRKRFYSFDADIFRFSGSVHKNLSTIFSTSLRYQFESIRQFDATEEKDYGMFKIGGVMGSLSMDLRNDGLNPTSGLFMGVSYEVANPSYGAMDDSNLVVDYTRLISRNKLYIPFGKNWTTACFASVGVEKNLARDVKRGTSGETLYDESGDVETNGYIPSVKVFRINGLDQIRGFSDTESNMLSSGEDISDITIRDRAYFSNFKIEQRYRLDDSTALGLFFDGGRVFVGHFAPFDVRTSVGLSYKYITPVGSLNFEYGVKLKRQVNDAARESVGRFHLTIGSF